MTAYIVEVSYIDHDDDTQTDLFGPYRDRGRAEEFAAKITAKVDSIPQDNDLHLVLVTVRLLNEPRLRPIVREVREFYAADDDEDDDYGYGQNSADHATMRD